MRAKAATMHCRPHLVLALALVKAIALSGATLAFSSSSGDGSTASTTLRRNPIGRISKLDRTKVDTQTDNNFYSRPNLVTHTDDTFLSKLTQLYDESIPEKAIILDMMSSHVSHLPKSKLECNFYGRVDVHGMNEDELLGNDARRITSGQAFVRNLNENPSFLGIADTATFDAVLCCVGVQYLEEPEQVFAEVGRTLKPGGICIVSFTNRFFYQKALSGWMERGMKERSRLVIDYFRAAGGFDDGDIEVRGDGTGVLSQFLSLGGAGDPFVAVVARRNFHE